MSSPKPAVTLSIRVLPEMREQLEALADATGRTKSFLASEALVVYLANQAWQVEAIRAAVNKADSGKAKFITHNEVADWVDSWEDDDEGLS